MRKIEFTVLFALISSLLLLPFSSIGTSADVRIGPYKFELGRGFKFPSAPDSVAVFSVSEKSAVNEEWAMEVAKNFGFVNEDGGALKPIIDYYYKMPHFNPPSQREQEKGNQTEQEQVDDENRNDQGYELPNQPDPVWPPKGAEEMLKLYTFQLGNKFLKINENNGAIYYSNNNYMNFALEEGVGEKLSDDVAHEIAYAFMKNVDLPAVQWDPTDSEPLFSDVEVYQADRKSGEILNSYICMKELTFARQLYDNPVVGGGGAVRIAVGVSPKGGDYAVSSFSRLARILENPEIAQAVYTPSEAYSMLQEGEGFINNTLRFHAEGNLVIKNAYFAYYAPTGYQNADYLTPVWVFTAYDSEDPSNEMEFFINAKKEQSQPDETFVRIYTDKAYYTPNDDQQVGIELYCDQAENVVLYIGLYAPDGYFYSFPFWTPSFFPIVANLPAGFHLGPINFLDYNPIGEGPYNGGGHYAYFAMLMDKATYELICPISVAEFDIEE